ncbi:hypothetical protein [Salipaludibacillus sp. CF4.18]|uniref:hypothetical protein n=1 Tax=Salipaludibacillus sp. CF4.18 TaxID=3373081 RepID=UPI003EE554E4
MPTEVTEQPNKKFPFLPTVIQFALGGAVGVAGSMYLMDILPSFDFALSDWIYLTLAIIVSWFLNINLHEFGHLLFGKLSGYRLISYRVSVFSWDYENGRMKFSIKKTKGYSGLCIMIPPVKSQGRTSDLLYFSGGIIMNVLTGALTITATFFITGPLILLMSLYFLGGTALLFGAINLIPPIYKSASFY